MVPKRTRRCPNEAFATNPAANLILLRWVYIKYCICREREGERERNKDILDIGNEFSTNSCNNVARFMYQFVYMGGSQTDLHRFLRSKGFPSDGPHFPVRGRFRQVSVGRLDHGPAPTAIRIDCSAVDPTDPGLGCPNSSQPGMVQVKSTAQKYVCGRWPSPLSIERQC